MTPDPPANLPTALLKISGTGLIWGMASSDLNATLLVWPPGHVLKEHTNDERDVLLITLARDGVAVVDGHEHDLVAGTALLIEKGRSRSIRGGVEGIRYLSVHTRRGSLQIEAMS